MATNKDALTDLARAVVAELGEEADKISRQESRGYGPVLLTLFRPYIKAAVLETAGEFRADTRTRPFTVSMTLWDVSGGESKGELIGEADTTKVDGLGGAIGQIAAWIAEFHEDDEDDVPPEATPLQMSKRIPSLRTSISRGGGQGEFRTRYKIGEELYLAHATVINPDKIAD